MQPDCALRLAAFRGVAEDQHRTNDFSLGAADGGTGIINRNRHAIPAHQHRPLGEIHHFSLTHGFQGGIGHHLARTLLHDMKNLLNAAAGGFATAPTRHAFCLRIHELHEALIASGDHAIANAHERGLKPFIALLERALQVHLVQRNFHGGTQPPLLERLDHVAGWLGAFGSFKIGLVRIGCQENAGDVVTLTDDGRRLHAIHLTLERDVHHDEVRAQCARLLNRLWTGKRRTNHFATHVGKHFHNVLGDDAFIIDN